MPTRPTHKQKICARQILEPYGHDREKLHMAINLACYWSNQHLALMSIFHPDQDFMANIHRFRRLDSCKPPQSYPAPKPSPQTTANGA